MCENKVISTKLSKFLIKVNNIHEHVGLSLFDKTKPDTFIFKLWKLFLKACFFIGMGLVFCGSFKTFSTNDAFKRLICLSMFSGATFLFILDMVLYLRKKRVLELIDWCHWAEVQKIKLYPDRGDWFKSGRKKSLKLITVFKILVNFEVLVIALITPIFLFWWFGEPTLYAPINIRGHEERNSWIVFSLELLALTGAAFYLVHVTLFTLSILIIVINYILNQLKLIQICIGRINLKTDLPIQLKEIVELHSDTLKIIKKFSDLYMLVNIVFSIALVLSTVISLTAREEPSPFVCSIVIFFGFIYWFFAYFVEQIIEAEEDLRDEYYQLEWLDTNIKTRKLFLLATQEPKKIKFAGLFGKDHVCFERFGELLKMAYNFGIIMTDLARKASWE